MNDATKNINDNLDEKLESFESNLMQNLQKNGFPANPVAFPIDAVFEAAAKKGFSFNKIRERLREKGVHTDLEETRIVFSKEPSADIPDSRATPQESGADTSFDELAKSLLSRISPEQLKSFRKLVGELGSEQVNAMKEQLEAMSESEKKGLLEKMAGLLR